MRQEGQAWGTSFGSLFFRDLSSWGGARPSSTPCFSHSPSDLPLPVLLGKFPILAWPAAPCLGESLPHGTHSAQLTFQGPLGRSGPAARAGAAGTAVSQRTGTFCFCSPVCEMGSVSLSSNVWKAS